MLKAKCVTNSANGIQVGCCVVDIQKEHLSFSDNGQFNKVDSIVGSKETRQMFTSVSLSSSSSVATLDFLTPKYHRCIALYKMFGIFIEGYELYTHNVYYFFLKPYREYF